MKAPSSKYLVHPSLRAAPAFTLIELLVVISIIALLAGVLLPVTTGVMENAKKASAKNTETNIVAAIRSYQSDYSAYPSFTGSNSGTDTTVGGTTASNANLFKVLRAKEDDPTTSSNTKRVVYFEGKDVKVASKPKDGFATAAGKGNNNAPVAVGDFVDPWGNLYFVRFDSGYTDQLMNPYGGDTDNDPVGASFDSTKMMKTGVIVWSYGKDGQRGNAGTYSTTNLGDDVVSW